MKFSLAGWKGEEYEFSRLFLGIQISDSDICPLLRATTLMQDNQDTTPFHFLKDSIIWQISTYKVHFFFLHWAQKEVLLCGSRQLSSVPTKSTKCHIKSR